MPLDAVFLRAVTEELRAVLPGQRVDKVRQPARDQIVLELRAGRLLLCAGAGAPRIQMTRTRPENPEQPPMFCMLLRKHLSGARIAALDQPPLERLVRLSFDAADELGRTGRRELVLEAMGRRSNLILLDGEGRIIDCLRRVDAEMSPSRQVLPGLFYEPPAAVGRLPVTEETEAGYRARFRAAPPEQRAEQFLLSQYFGISPLLAREAAFRAAGDTEARLWMPEEPGMEEKLWRELSALIEGVRENRFTPTLLKRLGKPFDFTCFPILQYGPEMETVHYSTFAELLDAYYEAREQQERARARGAELVRTAATARDRIRRKLALQEKDYAATLERDALRRKGDLITANLYRMERGQSRLVCEDFYGAPGDMAEIPLDPLLTPQQNAAKYYKRYTKAKTAEKYLREQMELARRDLEYLESVLEELDRAETEADFLEIRRELRDGGFLRARGNRDKDRREDRRLSRPREFRTAGGFRIQAGRNNRQNDALTKSASRQDLWFHAQKIHGAHVLLRTEGRTPDPADLSQAAATAAFYSQARESGRVPVDWCPAGHVKKPAGARPGMVVYTGYQTLTVTPGLPHRPKE